MNAHPLTSRPLCRLDVRNPTTLTPAMVGGGGLALTGRSTILFISRSDSADRRFRRDVPFRLESSIFAW